MKEIKIDIMNKDMIIFAEDRLKRPIDKCDEGMNKNFKQGYKNTCPFCLGNEDICDKETFRIDSKDGWLVKSIYNKYPIIDNKSDKVYGLHEVMIDTNRHNGNFYNMTEREFENLITMYKHRSYELKNKDNVEYVSIFKNYLRQAGASLDHPHSQIITLPFVPPEIKNELLVAEEYFKINKRCMYENLIKEEINLDERMIYNGEKFIVIIPAATKYTGEIRIIFKDKISFEDISDSSINELAQLLEKLFKKIYEVEGNIPFNILIHTYPKNYDCNKFFNSHIHIIPRKYSFGGFELGTGLYVSSRKPEEIANKLKLR